MGYWGAHGYYSSDISLVDTLYVTIGPALVSWVARALTLSRQNSEV